MFGDFRFWKSFDKSHILCLVKSCGRPTELENVAYSEIVDIDNLAFTFGDVARVKCQKWYV